MSESLLGFIRLPKIRVDLTGFFRSLEVRVDLMGHVEFIGPITCLDFSFFKPGQGLGSPRSTNLVKFNNYNYIKWVLIKKIMKKAKQKQRKKGRKEGK
jgi:hypothetical protein